MEKRVDLNEIILLEDFKTAIKVDEDEKIIFAYDIENDEPQWHTEGKLKESCQEMAKIIEEHYKIKVADYGVGIIEEIYDVNAQPVNNVLLMESPVAVDN